jgi:hypothetical protein
MRSSTAAPTWPRSTATGLDLLRRHEPALVAHLRIIATTAAGARAAARRLAGHRRRHARARHRPRSCPVHEAPAMATTLDELLLARFVRVEPEVSRSSWKRERAGRDQPGYAKLG